MKLRKGNEVVISRNLGRRVGKPNNYYYNGGKIDTVPLGTKAVIAGREEGSVIVHTEKGKKWLVHADEIRPSVDSYLVNFIAPKLKFPGGSLFRLSKKFPLFITNGQVYTTSETQEGEDVWEKKGFMGLFKKRTPLVRLETVVNLDETFANRIGEEVDELRRKFSETVLEDVGVLDHSFEGDFDTAQLIYSTVFPHLRDTNYREKIQALLSSPGSQEQAGPDISESFTEIVRSSTKKAMKDIRRIAGEFESEAKKDERSKFEKKRAKLLGIPEPKFTDGSLSERVLDGRDIAIIEGKGFSLFPTDEEAPKNSAVLAGQRFELVKGEDVRDLNFEYKKNLALQVGLESLRGGLSEEAVSRMISARLEGVEKVSGKREYSEGDFGFLHRNNQVFVFLEVPAFAIQSQYDGNHYFFDKTRVAVRVENNGGELDYYSNMYMVDNNNHPFLHNERGRFTKICTGDLKMPSKGSDTGEIVAKRLRRVKESLMFGYTNNTYKYCYRLEGRCKKPSCLERHFDENRMSQEKIKRMGVPIIVGGDRG